MTDELVERVAPPLPRWCPDSPCLARYWGSGVFSQGRTNDTRTGVAVKDDLPERLEGLYARLKDFPEAGRTPEGTLLKKDAWLALLDMRQLLEREVIPALFELRAIEADTVKVPRLSLDRPASEQGL